MPRPQNKPGVFIIAEAGSNWKAGSPAQDWKRACELVNAAKHAGADAVKFQTFRADSVYVPNAGSSGYLSKNGIQDSITDIFKRLAMPYEMIPRLASYCRKKKIEFMSSFFSTDDFHAVDPWVRRHKIASYEITHLRLLELAARSKKPLILSTGASTVQDIDWAVNYFYKQGGKEISLMQCTAKYPAPLSALTLRVIPFLAKRYGVCAGFSDHSTDALTGPVAAAALGAKIIEKHFTLNRKLKGPDHAFAIEPGELRSMVHAIRGCQAALGDGNKHVLPQERELYFYAQRALQAVKEISRGDILREGDNLAILRPGSRKKGAHPRFILQAQGRRAKRNIALGNGIQKKDF